MSAFYTGIRLSGSFLTTYLPNPALTTGDRIRFNRFNCRRPIATKVFMMVSNNILDYRYGRYLPRHDLTRGLDTPQWRISMALFVATVLRILSGLDDILDSEETPCFLFLFVLASGGLIAFDFDRRQTMKDQYSDLTFLTQPELAGLLAACAYIYWIPFGTSAWFHNLIWWFWAAYLVERK